MFYWLFRTTQDPALTILRLVLGVVFFAHGSQKVFGWLGGQGFSSSMQFFTEQMGIPAVFAFLAIAAEFLGGLGLIVGFLSRIAAVGIIVDMAVAVAMVHAPFGFFMNWLGTKQGEGFEFHLLAIGIGLAVLLKGSGALSIDHALSRRVIEAGARLERPAA
jgi:putative oxidoreductase